MEESKKPVRCILLFSGGLDSMCAGIILSRLGVEVIAFTYRSFVNGGGEKREEIDEMKDGLQNWSPVRQMAAFGIRHVIVDFNDQHLAMVRDPTFGYGKNMNPCIDCKVGMMKDAKSRMADYGASFLATGEVVGQRPMSQRTAEVLNRVHSAAGVEDLVLCPLSAKLLSPTLAEREGWVDREKLLDINGRTRKRQLALAREFSLTDFQSPGGGCCLTDPIYAYRLKDYFGHEGKDSLSIEQTLLLKIGRHFRFSDTVRVVVARDAAECQKLKAFFMKSEQINGALVDVPKGSELSGPIILVSGRDITPEALDFARSVYLDYTKARGQDGVMLCSCSRSLEVEDCAPAPVKPREELQERMITEKDPPKKKVKSRDFHHKKHQAKKE